MRDPTAGNGAWDPAAGVEISAGWVLVFRRFGRLPFFFFFFFFFFLPRNCLFFKKNYCSLCSPQMEMLEPRGENGSGSSVLMGQILRRANDPEYLDADELRQLLKWCFSRVETK